MKQQHQEQKHEQHGQCDNPPVQLHAKAREVCGAVEWSLGFDKHPANGARVEVELKKGSGARDIIFHISPSHGLDISFDSKDPIWVGEGGECPPSPGINTSQIQVMEVTHKKLRIHDLNNEKCDLTYQLNFVGADPLDPMIRNGGRV